MCCSYVEESFEADPEFTFQQFAIGRVSDELLEGWGGEIGALVVRLQFEDRKVDGQADAGWFDAEKKDAGRLQLLPQCGDRDGGGVMVDDGYVADVHPAGFEDLREEVELSIRKEGRAGGVDDDRNLAAVVAEELVGVGIGDGCGW